MNKILSRLLVLGIGILIGAAAVASAFYLFRDNPSELAESIEDVHGSLASSESKITLDTSARSSTAENPLPSKIDALVFPRQRFDRRASIISWISVLSAEELLNWLVQSIEPNWQVSYEIRAEFQQLLIEKLTTLAPESTLEVVLENSVASYGSPMIDTVFTELAHINIDQAMVAAKEFRAKERYLGTYVTRTILDSRADLPIEQLREIAIELGDEQQAYFSYFSRYAQSEIENPKETWYEIVDIANRADILNSAGFALGIVAAVWVNEAGLEILDEIVSTFSQTTDTDEALAAVFGRIANKQPEAIFDYVMANMGERASKFIERGSFIYSWARENPKSLLDKAKTLQPSSMREQMYSIATREWAAQTPLKFLEQLEQVPPGHRSLASQTAIRELVRSSPNVAAEYVLGISDESLQATLAESLVYEWSTQDVDATEEWVWALPTSSTMRTALVQRFVHIIARTEPRRAFELALQQPIDETEAFARAAESSILAMIAYADIDLAMELLPRVRDVAKPQAYASIGSTLIRNGAIQQALDLAKQLPEKDSTQFYQRVASSWAMYDQDGFLDAFESLVSNETAKSKIALTVVAMNSTNNRYSDDEIALLKQHLSHEDKELLKQLEEVDVLNPAAEHRELFQQVYGW